MERDNRTRFGARAPGVEQQRLLERRRFNVHRPPAQNGDQMYATGSVKDRGKPRDVQAASNGQAQSDIPALKPYWGKPAVRNFREGHGNVGIIRSPLRAIALPDQSNGFGSGQLTDYVTYRGLGSRRSVSAWVSGGCSSFTIAERIVGLRQLASPAPTRISAQEGVFLERMYNALKFCLVVADGLSPH